MFKFIRLHKEAKAVLADGQRLLEKSQFTSLEEWEVKTFLTKALPLADQCASTTLPRDAAGLYVLANMITSVIDYGVPACEEAFAKFIQTMQGKIAVATSQYQKIAYREAIKLMQSTYHAGLS